MSAVSAVSALVAAIALAATLTACPGASCPYPNTSGPTITPAEPCLQAQGNACVNASLVIKNTCQDALYMPADDAVLSADSGLSPGAEIEVLPQSTITYELRSDKATTNTAARQDYTIQARLASTPITISFSILAAQ